MANPRPYVGITKLPDPMPKNWVASRRTCGCYLLMTPDSPACSEFVCDHGYFVSQERKPPPPDGIIAHG